MRANVNANPKKATAGMVKWLLHFFWPERVVHMPGSTEAERRLAHEQALANTRIEGHVPTAEFLADVEAVVSGSMTSEQARAASLAHALKKDQDAAVAGLKRAV